MLPRAVHPAAWWVWALGLAVSASRMTNPLLLLLIFAVICLVVSARRGDSPWAKAFRLYVMLGAFIIGLRLVLYVVVGLKSGQTLLVDLPTVTLPEWAAGINLGGPLHLEGVIAKVLEGAQLAMIIIAIGAANALANPKRLLKSLPSALQEIGAAVVISVTVAPQLAESVQRVMRARALRGDTARGLRAVPRVAMPVLEDTLDRSIMLAAAMDARGYGRRPAVDRRQRWLTGALTLLGLLGACVGIFGILGPPSAQSGGARLLLVGGLALAAIGLWLAGRGLPRSSYRPDPFEWPEWVTCLCGLVPAAYFLGQIARATGLPALKPAAIDTYQSTDPLLWPNLPVIPTAMILLAALPAFVTPEPPRPVSRRPVRGRALSEKESEASHAR